uniref:cytochrome c oxidase subunit II n=1 Tax=Eudiplozoon nipponicum TaxID=116851 RepID=UPI001F13C369|nr:cytochrome c oxidase subunit II [Eudiplozoon nipponicum]UKQ56161.1 cytochrome c oxidase subunit II [Eudiplozoon nipponicum]
MTSNLYSFSSYPVMDLIVVYIWWLGILIFFWVFLSVLVGIFFSPFVGCLALNRLGFDRVEYYLILIFSCFILLLIFFNLMIMRSHNPSRGKHFDGFRGVISVIGRQWYWVYSFIGVGGLSDSMDSYYSCFVDCVDNGVSLSRGGVYCLNITSADVLHSFSLPSANMKIDAVPGRVNSVYLFAGILGRHLGYCSEFCGAGHGYMPIVFNVL